MILCMCNDISEQEWVKILADHGHDVASAQKACGAGECCGSCLPHLNTSAPILVSLPSIGPPTEIR